MKITAVLSLDANNAIGEGYKLAIRHSEDLKHFQEVTTNTAMVCGFNTLHQVRELHGTHGRELILWTEEPERLGPDDLEDFIQKGIRVMNRKDVLTLWREGKNVAIIGGAKTYRAFADFTDEVILTKFHLFNKNADKFLDIDDVYPRMTSLEVLKEHEDFKVFRIY